MLTLIHNATLLTMDAQRQIFSPGAIALVDDRIEAVGEEEDLLAAFPRPDRRIDARCMVAMPGFVNAHTHLVQSLQRGLSDDLELLSFLRELAFPLVKTITARHVAVGGLLGCAVALRTGTTCIVDNLTGEIDAASIDATVEAMLQSGIRGVVAVSLAERTARCDAWEVPSFIYTTAFAEQIELFERSLARWQGADAGRVMLCPAPVTTWANPAHSFQEAHRLAEAHGLLLHTHVAENQSEVQASLEDHGQREVEWLHSLGVLGPRFMVVHGVWLSEREVDLLAGSRASVVHCPTSNMYLASGIAPVPLLREAGVVVALGSDGIGNHNHDMFPVLRAASLLHKVAHYDPTVTSAEEVLEMATIGGAQALGMESEIGSLEVGKKADLILVHIDRLHLIPVHRVASALVYGAHGGDVDTVIVDGQIVVQGGVLQRFDEREILREAAAAALELVQQADLQSLCERPWIRQGGSDE